MRFFAYTALAAVTTAKIFATNDLDFIGYIAKYGKSYNSIEDFNIRYELFRAVDAVIKDLNATEKTSIHGHNFMSDFTAADKKMMLGRNNKSKPDITEETIALVSTPLMWDWRNKGKVNPVKN